MWLSKLLSPHGLQPQVLEDWDCSATVEVEDANVGSSSGNIPQANSDGTEAIGMVKRVVQLCDERSCEFLRQCVACPSPKAIIRFLVSLHTCFLHSCKQCYSRDARMGVIANSCSDQIDQSLCNFSVLPRHPSMLANNLWSSRWCACSKKQRNG